VEDASGRTGVVVAGDFNAWAKDWSSASTTARGRALLEVFASLDLVLLNTGSQHTFSRAGIGSIVDLTFASPSLSVGARWLITDAYTASDCEAILVTFGADARGAQNRMPYSKGYRTEKFNRHVFSEALQSLTTAGSAENRAQQMEAALTQACDRSMRRRTSYKRAYAPTFWHTRFQCETSGI